MSVAFKYTASKHRENSLEDYHYICERGYNSIVFCFPKSDMVDKYKQRNASCCLQSKVDMYFFKTRAVL